MKKIIIIFKYGHQNKIQLKTIKIILIHTFLLLLVDDNLSFFVGVSDIV